MDLRTTLAVVGIVVASSASGIEPPRFDRFTGGHDAACVLPVGCAALTAAIAPWHGEAAAAPARSDAHSSDPRSGAELPARKSPSASVQDLPVVEVAARGPPAAIFAVMLSGDGGWAALDRGIADALSAKGIPVIGLDSLRYFWNRRTPQELAVDVDRLIRFYAGHWSRRRVLLIGYSQGADVLPFAVNRLPAATRAMVSHTVLISPGLVASFEFHVGNWLGRRSEGLPVVPEMRKLSAATSLCLYGADEPDSACPTIPASQTRSVALPGGHHFDGAYGRLAQRILDEL